MIRVMLADDHEVVRVGFRMILEQDPDVRVVAEAADGAQAYAIVAREKPDILLMDISMPPGQSGLVACEKIAKDFPGTKVVILTMSARTDTFTRYAWGASGHELKNSTSEELIAAVHAVAEGGSYIHPKMTAMLTKQLVDGGEEEDRSYQQLSNRELEILQLLAKGFTNKEISEQIFLSVKTVEAHRSKIYQKLGLKTRADLVDYALRHKLLNVKRRRRRKVVIGIAKPRDAPEAAPGHSSPFGAAGLEARPRVNDRARVGQASMHEPQAMQSPARTIASHPSSAGSRIAGSDRHGARNVRRRNAGWRI